MQTHYNYYICVPYRTEITHSYAYHFRKSARSRKHHSGLDYSKLVIIDKPEYIEDKIVKLSTKEIYYFETVDNKVFSYTAKETYEVHKKLYEIEQEFEHTDFLRISKSVIVNVSKIAYVKPIFNGRFEAKLKNDEKIIVSRQYVVELKKKLGI